MSNYVTVCLSHDEAKLLEALLNFNAEKSALAREAMLDAGLEPSDADRLGTGAWQALSDALINQ